VSFQKGDASSRRINCFSAEPFRKTLGKNKESMTSRTAFPALYMDVTRDTVVISASQGITEAFERRSQNLHDVVLLLCGEILAPPPHAPTMIATRPHGLILRLIEALG
jgi:hypothetical protein